MTIWLLAIGAVSLLAQVVLLRELVVAFYGSELIYLLGIGVWLLGTAAGAAAGRRGWSPPPDWVRRLLVALAVAIPLAVVAARAGRLLLGAVPGAYPPFGRQLLGLGLVLLPVSALLGLLFQWAAKVAAAGGGGAGGASDRRRGRSLPAAYGIESAGALAGGALATLLPAWGVTSWQAALLAGLLAAAAALPGSVGRRDRTRAAALAVLLAGTVLLAAGDGVDRALTAWSVPDLVAVRDTPYGRLAVSQRAGQVVIYENGALAAESQGTRAEEFAHLAAVQHPRPRRMLLLGGTLEGLPAELLRHGPRLLTVVELDPAHLEAALDHLPPDSRRALAAGAVELVTADPRRFLARDGRSWDLLLVAMPPPDSGRTNRYYTREFFRLAARRLAPGGVLALRLRAGPNYWTPLVARRTATVVAALREAFADAVVLPGTDLVVAASDAPLPRTAAEPSRRLRERGVTARLVSPAYLDYLYANDRFREIPGRLAGLDVAPNSDRAPVCYRQALLIWLSRFFPGAARLELPVLPGATAGPAAWPRLLAALLARPAGWGTVALLLLAALAARRRPAPRATFLAGLAGLWGMVLEGALLLHYQTVSGVLYQDLGVLLTAFMAGLSAGALAADRLLRHGGEVRSRRAGALLGAGLALGTVGVAALVGGGRSAAGLAAVAAAQLACGFLVAAVFGQAALRTRLRQGRLVSPLYAADLLGGAGGSLLASLLLVPLAGLGGTALATLPVVLAMLLLL